MWFILGKTSFRFNTKLLTYLVICCSILSHLTAYNRQKCCKDFFPDEMNSVYCSRMCKCIVWYSLMWAAVWRFARQSYTAVEEQNVRKRDELRKLPWFVKAKARGLQRLIHTLPVAPLANYCTRLHSKFPDVLNCVQHLKHWFFILAHYPYTSRKMM